MKYLGALTTTWREILYHYRFQSNSDWGKSWRLNKSMTYAQPKGKDTVSDSKWAKRKKRILFGGHVLLDHKMLSPVALLPRRVPDLCLDSLPFGLNTLRGKLHSDRRLALKVKLVAREPREDVGLADTRVSNEHNWAGIFVRLIVFN